MPVKVSNEQKKELIRWFLNHHQLKRRESVWILNYIISREELLDKLHFVENASKCPKACVISAVCSEQVTFRYYKGSVMITDAEKAFHDIRLNRDQDLYLQLNFKSSNTCEKYIAVLEENPSVPSDHIEDNTFTAEVEKFITTIEKKQQKERLMQQIDEALIKNDKKSFMSLSEAYKKL